MQLLSKRRDISDYTKGILITIGIWTRFRNNTLGRKLFAVHIEDTSNMQLG